MSDVKRYSGQMMLGDTSIPAGFMRGMVKGEDYDALLAENEQLRIEAARLIGDIAQIEVMRDEFQAERDQLRAELEAIRGQQPIYQIRPSDNVREWCDVHPDGYRIAKEMNDMQVRIVYALPPQKPDAVSVPGVHEFAVEILRGALEGGNFDGGDIQEMGVRHGLLFPEHRTERCGEHCECAECGFPVECFRIARALLSTKNVEEVQPCDK